VYPAERTAEVAVDPLNLNQIILAEGKNTNSNIKSTINISPSKKVALTAVMSALIAVTTLIAIPLPPPLSTLNLAPVIIFVVSILLGARVGATATAIGCAIGYLAGTSLGTILIPPGFVYIYLVGLVVARTPMALTAGFLRKKSEIASMTLGVVVETLVFFFIDLFLFGIAIAIFDFGVFIDLVSVPITFAVLLAVRRMLNVKYLA
jgi:uncharacterized membrane protein